MFNLLIILAEIIILFLLSRALTQAFSNLLFRASQNQTVTIQLLSFLFLPGIIIHELSHLLVASLLFVPAGEIEFLPKVTEGGVKLGSAAIGKTDPVRRAIIGLAPVLVGITLLWAVFSFYSQSSYQLFSWETLVLFYVVFQVGNTMFSSTKDLEGFLEVLLTGIFIGVVFYVFILLSGITILSMSLPPNKIEVVTSPLAVVGGLAVIIDVFLIVFLQIISRFLGVRG